MNAHPTAAAAGTIDVGGDLTVNRMGFGAMRITGPGIWGEPPSRDQAIATLRRVVELGVNFIDTADSYGPGVSEPLIAEALYPYPADLVIATKGGLVRPGPNRWEANGRPEHLREACEGSLRRLRLEQIPLYQFHRPDPAVPLAESIGAIAEMKNEGKIRHVGISNVSESQLREAQRIVPIVSIQNRYNASDRRSESLIDLCEQEQLVFLPWAPVQEADKNPAVAAAAERHGVTQHQVVLAWLLAASPQILPIPGTGSPRHAEENIAAASVELDPDEVEAISKGVLPARPAKGDDLPRFRDRPEGRGLRAVLTGFFLGSLDRPDPQGPCGATGLTGLVARTGPGVVLPLFPDKPDSNWDAEAKRGGDRCDHRGPGRTDRGRPGGRRNRPVAGREDSGGRGAWFRGAIRRGRRRRDREVGAARLHRCACPRRRARGRRRLGGPGHQRADQPGHRPRPRARRDQPGRPGLPRRHYRRRARSQRQPGLRQPDRRADRRDQVLGPHRGRDGAPRAGRPEVRAGREPQARLRRAERDPGRAGWAPPR